MSPQSCPQYEGAGVRGIGLAAGVRYHVTGAKRVGALHDAQVANTSTQTSSVNKKIQLFQP